MAKFSDHGVRCSGLMLRPPTYELCGFGYLALLRLNSPPCTMEVVLVPCWAGGRIKQVELLVLA